MDLYERGNVEYARAGMVAEKKSISIVGKNAGDFPKTWNSWSFQAVIQQTDLLRVILLSFPIHFF